MIDYVKSPDGTKIIDYPDSRGPRCECGYWEIDPNGNLMERITGKHCECDPEFHEVCDLCGRELKSGKSKRLGIGPECLAKYSLDIAVLFSKADDAAFDEYDADIIVAYIPQETEEDGARGFLQTCPVQVLIREREMPYEIIDLMEPTLDNIEKAHEFTSKYLHDGRIMRTHKVTHIDSWRDYYTTVNQMLKADGYEIWEHSMEELLWRPGHGVVRGYGFSEIVAEVARDWLNYAWIDEDSPFTLDLERTRLQQLADICWQTGYATSWDGIPNLIHADPTSIEQDPELVEVAANFYGIALHADKWLKGYATWETDIKRILTIANITVDNKHGTATYAPELFDVPTTVWLG